MPSLIRNAIVFLLFTMLSACGAGSGQSGTSSDMAAGEADDSWIQPVGPQRNAPGSGQEAASTSSGGGGGGGGGWSIVLRTFADQEQQAQAAVVLHEVQQLSPVLLNARLARVGNGAAVVYGRYEGPTDPQAQQDLAQIKAIAVRNARPFAKAMLSRVRSHNEPLSPYDLMNLRRMYPDVNPLYTLQVAVWGNFEDTQQAADRAMKAAENYCAKLRSEGIEAYVHHGTGGLSKVCVGVFDRSAFDPETGLLSPELEALKRRFPAHLVNGEPLLEPVKGYTDAKGRPLTRTQAPKLVEVPK